jgi:hypothetical protein
MKFLFFAVLRLVVSRVAHECSSERPRLTGGVNTVQARKLTRAYQIASKS